MTASDDLYLYGTIEPYNTGFLQVSDIHSIYYEECGNKAGNPIIFVHGGPGGGLLDRDRRYFDPSAYRIILFDQRGAGKSTPAAELKENTTWHLVSDMEKLREYLRIETWVVFGGSWGSTLSLAYAETHPDRVKAMILRGIFTLRRRELLWYYQDGASFLFPDYWENFIKPIPMDERSDLMAAYYRRLTGDDENVKQICSKAWSAWEMATSRLVFDPMLLKQCDDDLWSLQFARIECHYFVNGGWFKSDSQLLDNAHKLANIPCTIVQGRYDVVCPAETAWLLHKQLPSADFHLLPTCGHSTKETEIAKVLVQAADKYKHL